MQALACRALGREHRNCLRKISCCDRTGAGNMGDARGSVTPSSQGNIHLFRGEYDKETQMETDYFEHLLYRVYRLRGIL